MNKPADVGTAVLIYGKTTSVVQIVPVSGVDIQIRSGLADGSLQQLGYNVLRGVPFFQLDLRVSKTFAFAEQRHRVEFMSQFFDLTNRANYGGNFNGNIRTATFGQPLGYVAPSAVIVPKSFAAELAVQYRF